MESNKYGYLAKNTLLFAISSFSSKILVFLLVPLYTSILTTSEYGSADLITTTSNLLIFIVTVNVGDAVLRFVIGSKDKGKEIFGYGIEITFKGNFIFILLLSIVAFFNPMQWEYYLYIFLGINVLCNSFLNLSSNYLRSIDRVKDVAVGGIISTIITIVCNIVTLIILKWGIIGYLISMVAGPFVTTIYYFSKCDELLLAVKYSTKDEKLRKAMLSYSFPLILNGIAWWANASLDKYFIVGFLDASSNGIYSVAQKIPTILTTFSTIFMQAWNLSAIKEYDANDSDGFFANTYKIINGALVISCSLLILLNIPLAHVLYAKDFFIAWQCSSWLLVSIVFSAMSSFEGSIFSAVKKTKIASISTVVSALVNITLNLVLIPIFGVQGAAIATVISFFSVWLLRYMYAKRYINCRINLAADILTYLFLIIQVILERIEGHCYIGQITIVLMILIINRNNLNIFYKKLKDTYIIDKFLFRKER